MDLVKFKSAKYPNINQWAAEINYACEGTTVPPCLLAAIVQRESKGRNILQEGMPPGADCGVGLCQITSGVDWSSLTHPTYDQLDLLTPSSNLHVAVNNFLEGLIKSATEAQAASPVSFEAACRGQIVFAAACGYNAGWGNVQRALIASADADSFIPTTSGAEGPYGANVLELYTGFVEESHAA